jgi:UDP-N-acetylglucosamine 1-carboxyvinyltransferase
MDKMVITGGERLFGEVKVSGAKNAALPLLAATILAQEPCTIRGVPRLRDVTTIQRLLTLLGLECSGDSDVTIDPSGLSGHEASYDLVKTMRASILVLGPLLARLGKARVSLPGGCAIGARPVDQHLKGLKAMGAKIEIDHGYVVASADRLRGARIYLDIPTVTGTMNLIMAATLAEGETVLQHAAMEPEVSALCEFLRKMGANIEGDDSDIIRINGVEQLGGATIDLIPDRIEAGTLMIAAGMTKGNVLVKNFPLDFLKATVSKMREAGLTLEPEGDGVRVIGPPRITSVDIKTLPYPGFPTDLQAQFMALMSVATGISIISETIFENRFMHVLELRRMGAAISIEGRSAVVRGVPLLSGAEVMATDLRASASLVLAGLAAHNTTEVHRIYHLDRGYERIEDKLAALGANIRREKETQ